MNRLSLVPQLVRPHTMDIADLATDAARLGERLGAWQAAFRAFDRATCASAVRLYEEVCLLDRRFNTLLQEEVKTHDFLDPDSPPVPPSERLDRLLRVSDKISSLLRVAAKHASDAALWRLPTAEIERRLRALDEPVAPPRGIQYHPETVKRMKDAEDAMRSLYSSILASRAAGEV